MTPSNWDATTVGGSPSVAGPLKDRANDHADRDLPFKPHHSENGDRTVHAVSGNFVKEADYLLGDRPFFVSIGKDGLIAALQKLDMQLRNVSA